MVKKLQRKCCVANMDTIYPQYFYTMVVDDNKLPWTVEDFSY